MSQRAGLAALAAIAGVVAVVECRQAASIEAALGDAARERAIAVAQRQHADLERQLAGRALGEQQREAARDAIVRGDFARAVPYLLAARDHGIDDAGLRGMFHTATAVRVSLALRHAGLRAVSFSADGATIVTAGDDRTARRWDATSGAAIGAPLVHPHPVAAASLSPDGAHALTISDDDAWLWDLAAVPPSATALHHAGRVNAAVFSADGTTVVTASDDHTARVWDARTGAPQATLVHPAMVKRAAISRDGTRVATVVPYGTSAAIWDARRGTRLAPLMRDGAGRGHAALVVTAVFSPDGHRLATADAAGTALLWDPATATIVAPAMHHDGEVRDAAWSPDGTQLATSDGTHVRLWNTATGAAAGALDGTAPPFGSAAGRGSPAGDGTAAVGHLAYSADGARLLAAAADAVQIWDVAGRTLAAAIQLDAGEHTVGFSPDGQRVIAAGDDRARVWSVRSTAPRVLVARSSGDRMFGASYSPDGTRIAVGWDSSTLELWTAAGVREARIPTESAAVLPVFSRDGARILAAVPSGFARIVERFPLQVRALPFDPEYWHPPTPGAPPPRRIEDGEVVEHRRSERVPRADLSPDGRRFATATGASAARVWDVATGHPVSPALVHANLVVTVRFDPTGTRVVTASADGTARVWDVATGTQLGAPLVHPDGTRAMLALFSPDGAQLVTLADDQLVRFWDARSDAHPLLAQRAGHAAAIAGAVFSPDGRTLATFGDASVRLWDVARHQLATAPIELPDFSETAAFSSDGERLVIAYGHRAQIFDAHAGLALAPPFDHPDYVTSASFSPDGATVLSVGLDAVRLWDAGLDDRPLATWRGETAGGGFSRLDRSVR